MKNLKKWMLAGLIIIIVLVVGVFVLKQIKERKENEQNSVRQTELKTLTADQIKSDTFYVNYRDAFYEVAKGTTNFEDGALVREPNPERVVTFTDDDGIVPTMFMDDNLIMKSSSVPNTFTWERFQDLGYTIGVWGLKENSAGKYSFPPSTSNVNLYSSFCDGLRSSETLTTAEQVIIDKINNNVLKKNSMSAAGTVSDLMQGQTYALDLYVGTSYFGVQAKADTHVLSSFETYETSSYDYIDNGYIRVTIPDYFKSGYYYINGMGLLRYVARPRSEGATGVLFNQPYYLGKDADGNYILADDVEDPENPDEEKNGEVFNFTSVIDTSTSRAEYKVTYTETNIPTEIKYNIVYGISPKAVLIAPDGKQYPFKVSETDVTNTLICTLEMPISGTYTIKISGMDYRTFDVSQVIETGKADALFHTGNGTGELVFRANKDYKKAELTVSWEQQSRAATAQLFDDSVKKNEKASDILSDSARSTMMSHEYGSVTYMIDDLKEGYYRLAVTGDSLGYVRYTLTESVEEQTEEETDESAEGESETSAEGETASTESTEAEESVSETEGKEEEKGEE